MNMICQSKLPPIAEVTKIKSKDPKLKRTQKLPINQSQIKYHFNWSLKNK